DQYEMLVQRYYETRTDEQYQETYRQIHIDIPRMSPLVPLFQQPIVQQVSYILFFIEIKLTNYYFCCILNTRVFFVYVVMQILYFVFAVSIICISCKASFTIELIEVTFFL